MRIGPKALDEPLVCRVAVVASGSETVVDGPLDMPAHPQNALCPNANVAGAIRAMDLAVELPDGVFELAFACDRQRQDVIPMQAL